MLRRELIRDLEKDIRFWKRRIKQATLPREKQACASMLKSCEDQLKIVKASGPVRWA